MAHAILVHHEQKDRKCLRGSRARGSLEIKKKNEAVDCMRDGEPIKMKTTADNNDFLHRIEACISPIYDGAAGAIGPLLEYRSRTPTKSRMLH
ncbi:unnamed protein product [Phytomonas sp. EM1]|nr:unnamed protein product [Phytomonas sp. EM1]|eukprot:CCW61191.1 unnamed protein product [Phytomonas sp. isolate EM1]